jgi:hypothetical protein
LLDVVTVLALLGSFVFIFGRDLRANPAMLTGVKWAGAIRVVMMQQTDD